MLLLTDADGIILTVDVFWMKKWRKPGEHAATSGPSGWQARLTFLNVVCVPFVTSLKAAFFSAHFVWKTEEWTGEFSDRPEELHAVRQIYTVNDEKSPVHL